MAEREVIVREAQLSDAQNLLDLLEELQEETDFLVAAPTLSLGEMKEFLLDRETSLNELCLVVSVGGNLVGLLNVASTSQFETSHIGDLFIAIREAYWGYGLGQLLMKTCLDWAEHSQLIARLELNVQKRNQRAIHLYEKCGFIVEGTKKRGVKSKNGEFLDVYLMGKLIG